MGFIFDFEDRMVEGNEIAVAVGFDQAEYWRLRQIADEKGVKLSKMVKAMASEYMKEHPNFSEQILH